jgi:hypothetical protein
MSTQSGEIEYNGLTYDEFMADPWADYNEDCDPGFQGRVIIDESLYDYSDGGLEMWNE